MHGYVARKLETTLEQRLLDFPAVARQCGKTTLARELVGGRKDAVYLDLERPSDFRKRRGKAWWSRT